MRFFRLNYVLYYNLQNSQIFNWQFNISVRHICKHYKKNPFVKFAYFNLIRHCTVQYVGQDVKWYNAAALHKANKDWYRHIKHTGRVEHSYSQSNQLQIWLHSLASKAQSTAKNKWDNLA